MPSGPQLQALRAPRLLPGGDKAPPRRVRGSQKAQAGFLYVSGSVYRRVRVFRFRAAVETYLRTLEAYRRQFGFRVHAYAVMPDHFHLLLWFPPDARLVDFLRDFKSLAGKRILEWLREEKLERLLSRFRLVRTPRRVKDARYCVLQYNSHVKPIVAAAAIRQKIQYIHANPVREGLAETPEAYPYSSARVYAGKGLSLVKIDRLELPCD